jgi:sugar phosphate permease
MPLLPVTIIDLMSPSVRGIAIGFFRTSFDIGSVIAPILLTWIATVWRIEGCFYLTAAVLLFNAVLSLTLRGRIN